MKKLILLFVIYLVTAISADKVFACEEHVKGLGSTENFPGNSIYQLSSQWIDDKGEKIKLSRLSGEPRLIAMIYTKCTTACPLLTQQLKKLLSSLSNEQRSSIHVDLFSFDSENETPVSMKVFIEKFNLDKDRWSLHASASPNVNELAAVLGVKFKKLNSGEFVHSNVIFLVDSTGQILAKHEGFAAPAAPFIKALNEAIGQVPSQKRSAALLQKAPH